MDIRKWAPLVVLSAVPLFAAAPSLQLGDISEGGQNVVIADFDGDGLDDLLEPTALRLNLDGRFSAPLSVTGVGGGDSLKAAGDYNGDGLADVIARNVAIPHREGPDRLLLGNGAGGFTAGPALPVAFGDAGHSAALDYDGDGRLDLVLMKARTIDPVAGITTTLSFFRGKGDGTFAPGQTVLWPYEIFPSMAFGDFDRNGHRDAVLSPNNRPYLHFYFADGNGRWHERAPRFTGVYAQLAPAADVNGDGDADLVLFDLSSGSTGLTVLFGERSGRFPTTARLAPVAYRDTPVVGDLYEGGGDEIAFMDGEGIKIVSGTGNELRVVTVAASEMLNTTIRAGRFRDGGSLDLLAFGRVGYWQPATRLVFVEGSVSAPAAPARVATRRTRAVSRASAATFVTYEGRTLGSCPPAGLNVWSFSREGIFVDFVPLDGASAAEGAMVNGRMMVRVTLRDGRQLAGSLAVTPERISGELIDMAKNACGVQGSLSVDAKRVHSVQ